jgi:hypothetical protein
VTRVSVDMFTQCLTLLAGVCCLPQIFSVAWSIIWKGCIPIP